MEREEFYDAAIKKWGFDSQALMCIEEMSELTKALCKYNRQGKENSCPETIYNVKEEIADVLNTVEQMALYFGREEIEEIRSQKIERCRSKINK